MTFLDVNPTILEEYKTFMHVDHERIYMIAILLNLIMILYVIIMGEENMVVENFMLLNYLPLF